MDLKLAIGIEQLLELIRQLPPKQRARVQELLEAPKASTLNGSKLEQLLLEGPTWNDEQLTKVQAAREALRKWKNS